MTERVLLLLIGLFAGIAFVSFVAFRFGLWPALLLALLCLIVLGWLRLTADKKRTL